MSRRQTSRDSAPPGGATCPRGLRAAVAAGVVLGVAAAAPADWPTCRGTPQRTGNIDGLPGPRKPMILWAYKAAGHIVASPVPGAAGVYVPALGPFNTGLLRALALPTDAAERVVWSKTAPYIRRPTVCAPALTEGLLVFGDGMHQTDDAILYCLHAQTGRMVWQYPVPGKLVHMEGSPTVADGRVYIGCGDAGVICVDLKRMLLDGKEQDFAAVRAVLEKRWAELLAAYEQQKKADPEFAIPPTDDDLPKPSPKLHWQMGRKAWHVDAPVAVAADRVLAASAFLDHEKVGLRALLCLKADDGETAWTVPLKINPWAGVTVAGELALVGCSSIRFDQKLIEQARGELVAVNVGTGKVAWRKAVPGGVLAAPAVKDGIAVFTATDGKVRAWEADTGKEKWAYDAAAPFFAGPAIAGADVYVADLKGVLHALRLADGLKLWTLSIPADPAVQTPGAVFGSPVVQGGRVYVGTCNLGSDAADQPCALVCVGDAAAAGPAAPVAKVTVDADRRAVIVPCRIAPRKLPTLQDIYPVEVIATLPAPRGQKAHETVVTTSVTPSDVHEALASLGLKPGKPARGTEGAAAGPEVDILLELPGLDGGSRAIPVESTLVDRATGRPLPRLTWHFTGSAMTQPDPNSDRRVYGADLAGTLISLFPVTDETVFQSNLTMAEEMLVKLDTNRGLLPPEGTRVKLVIVVRPPRGPARPDTKLDAPGDHPSGLLALPTQVTAPRPWDETIPLTASAEPPLPLADVRNEPRGLALPPGPTGLSMVAHLPPLAGVRRILAAPLRPMPVGPPAQAAPSDPVLAALLGGASTPDPDSLMTAEDSTAALLRQSVLETVPRFRTSPPPPLLLSIPDPFDLAEAIRMPAQPTDDDPPAPLSDPPRVELPVEK